MNKLNNKDKLTKSFIVTLSSLFFLWMLYTVFGHDILKAIKHGRVPLMFSNIIHGNSIHTVETYYEIVDNLVRGFLLLAVTIIIIFKIVFCSGIVNEWDSKQYFVFSGIISLLFLSTLLIHGPSNIKIFL